MAKTLCKYRRVEIADKFAAIGRMVSTANYMCSSCARVAAEKSYLCKPSALKRPGEMAHVIKPMLSAVETAKLSPLPDGLAQRSALPADLDGVAPTADAEASRKHGKKKRKQLKKLKKLAKKQDKQMKKAAKAARRYQQAIEQALSPG